MLTIQYKQVNPLHPNISMHILHSSLNVSYVADKENLFTNQELYLVGDHFLYSCHLNVWF